MAKKKKEESKTAKVYNISNGDNIFKFLKKSYNETWDLLTFSRDYFNSRGKIDKLQLSREDSLIYTMAMSTITTQLTSVLGWLLLCRAIEAGEVKMEDLNKENFRMPEFNIGIDPDDACFSVLNHTVRDILKKSSRLYARIKRLEDSIQQVLIEEESKKEKVTK